MLTSPSARMALATSSTQAQLCETALRCLLLVEFPNRKMNIHFRPTTEDDFDALVELRIEAMRESLEKIGRFDRERSLERFRASFVASDTTRIFHNETLVGFYALTHGTDHLHLGHLYVEPRHQNLGIGSQAMEAIIESSTKAGMPIRLGALKESRSNDFYRKQGFVVSSEDEWDTYYERPPKQET